MSHASRLLQGTVDLLILRALQQGPAHGYAVSRWVRERTDGVLAMEDAALYQALHRLEARAGSRPSGACRRTTGAPSTTRSPRRPPPAAQRGLGVEAVRRGGVQGHRNRVRWSGDETTRRQARCFAFPFRTREDVRADVRDEFAFHLDMRTDELMRAGLAEADARAQAEREFGEPRRRRAQACAREGDRVERRRRLGQFAGDLNRT